MMVRCWTAVVPLKFVVENESRVIASCGDVFEEKGFPVIWIGDPQFVPSKLASISTELRELTWLAQSRKRVLESSSKSTAGEDSMSAPVVKGTNRRCGADPGRIRSTASTVLLGAVSCPFGKRSL